MFQLHWRLRVEYRIANRIDRSKEDINVLYSLRIHIHEYAINEHFRSCLVVIRRSGLYHQVQAFVVCFFLKYYRNTGKTSTKEEETEMKIKTVLWPRADISKFIPKIPGKKMF